MQSKLKKTLPVYKAIFEMAIRNIPNPREAQGYRIEKDLGWKRQLKSRRSTFQCSDDGPAVMYVTNVHSDPNGDTFATGRLFSGKIKKG